MDIKRKIAISDIQLVFCLLIWLCSLFGMMQYDPNGELINVLFVFWATVMVWIFYTWIECSAYEGRNMLRNYIMLMEYDNLMKPTSTSDKVMKMSGDIIQF